MFYLNLMDVLYETISFDLARITRLSVLNIVQYEAFDFL